jgi:hypothetical protein
MRKHVSLVVVALLALVLTGCFTGVESTPKITADDVKREQIIVTAEQLYMDSVKPERFARWKPGKQFYVTDNKINLIFGATAKSDCALMGETIVYRDCRATTSVTGEEVVDLVFVDNQGHEYMYRVGMSVKEMLERENVEVPFTIELSVISDAKKKLQGNTYYILTSMWYDFNDEISHGRKFVPVKITDVKPGNHIYPLRLVCEDDRGVEFQLFMSLGGGKKSPRCFSALFSFTDPHLKYPMITDEAWQNIINGKVALDMTRDESRLSLGTPKEIDRRPGYSGVREMWIYENGVFLIFEDGLLREFRNDAVIR